MKTTFIYALCEPGTRTVRYIGKTDNPGKRLKQHKKDSIHFDSYLGRWLRDTISKNGFPDMVVLREVPFEQWEIAEERYIRLARGLGMRLVNTTEGGDGVVGISQEVREKLRVANSGEKNPFFGKRHTEEARAKISAAGARRKQTKESLAKAQATRLANGSQTPKGEKNPRFGTHLSEAAKSHLSETKKGSKNPMFGKTGAFHPMFGKKHTKESIAKGQATRLANLLKKKGQGVNLSEL